MSAIAPEVLAKLQKKGLSLPDQRPHMNIVFIGHVDAGKSTTCGNILCTTGMVDQRTMEKYEREAKENSRESWYFAYVMDINEEERQKGKTVEVGRASFELENRRFTILDAPGHKAFVSEMISGASQADIGVLIISARKGEFEAGYERGGQTQEHVLLAKTLGVNRLIIAINKMDEASVQWDQTRYDEIVGKMTPFLRKNGFKADEFQFVPCASLGDQNISKHVSDPNSSTFDARASWYPATEPTLMQILETCPLPERSPLLPLRVPLLSGYRDGSVLAVGKVESGTAIVDQPALIQPGNIPVKITAVKTEEHGDLAYAECGENVELAISGIEESQLRKGCVLSSVDKPVTVTSLVEAQFMLVDTLDHKPIMTAGYKAIFHAHTMADECEITKIVETVDLKTKKKTSKPAFARSGMVVTARIQLNNTHPLEPFTDCAPMGRFTLRDEGKTIGIGKILRVSQK